MRRILIEIRNLKDSTSTYYAEKDLTTFYKTKKGINRIRAKNFEHSNYLNLVKTLNTSLNTPGLDRRDNSCFHL